MQGSQQKMRTSRGCWRHNKETASQARSAARRWPLLLWQRWAAKPPLVSIITAEADLHSGLSGIFIAAHVSMQNVSLASTCSMSLLAQHDRKCGMSKI